MPYHMAIECFCLFCHGIYFVNSTDFNDSRIFVISGSFVASVCTSLAGNDEKNGQKTAEVCSTHLHVISPTNTSRHGIEPVQGITREQVRSVWVWRCCCI